MLHYGTAQQQLLGRVTLEELRQLYGAGHFKPGSMGPKVLAAMRFVDEGGDEAIIAELDALLPALEGRAGTHVHRIGAGRT